MSTPTGHRIRAAHADDGAELLRLWALMFGEGGSVGGQLWRGHARDWFDHVVGEIGAARFPVIEVGGSIVATAIGTLELGVPNPHCARGRTVRLANVFTLPEHRGKGYATLLVRDVIDWARSIGADRIDLSTTQEGQRVYEKVGFVLTSAPRMKLHL